MLTRRNVVIAGALFLIIPLALVLIFTNNPKKSPTYTIKTINKDTGQTIITDPNQSPEQNKGSGNVTVLGTDKLINSGMTSSQLTLFNKLINDYINIQLGKKYSQVAILNNGYKSDGNNITAQMRLGTSSNLVNLSVKYTDLYNIQVKISYNNDKYYLYDSGIQAAKPPSNVNNPHARPNNL